MPFGFGSFHQGDYLSGSLLVLADISAVTLGLYGAFYGALFLYGGGGGEALTQIGLDGPEAGQETLKQALALNPWLSERRFLIEDPGQDI